MFVDFLGKESSADCMGCSLASGQYIPPGGILFKSEYFYVNQDPLIPLNGFLVIGANRHIQNISQMSDTEYSDYSKIFRKTKRIIHDICNIESLTTVQEDYSIHFHTWFFPWDNKLLKKYKKPSLSFIREIMKGFIGRKLNEKEWIDLKKSLAEIREELNNE